MKRLVAKIGIVAGGVLAGAASVALAGQEPARHRTFATGAEAIDPADMAKLPAVPTYRLHARPRRPDRRIPQTRLAGAAGDLCRLGHDLCRQLLFPRRADRRQPKQPGELMSPAFLYNSLRPAGASCNKPLLLRHVLASWRDRGAVFLRRLRAPCSIAATPRSRRAQRARRAASGCARSGAS
ncbi:hypothetical protein AB5I41_12190 [Sphingomonas sp. MMS24-JH45]